MIKRNKLGQFIKGFHPSTEFKKGQKGYWLGKKRPDMMGKNNPSWKGGKCKEHNRWFIYLPNHPLAKSNGCIAQSRLIAEKYLNRYLSFKEQIHHINGDTLDDRPENLYLFSSNSAHIKYEFSKNKSILKSNI